MGNGASASPQAARAPPVSAEDLRQIIEVFDGADMDHSGELSLDEFRTLLMGLEKPKLSRAQVDAMIEAVDADGNSSIDRAEFLAWCISGDHRILPVLREVRKMQYDHQPGAFGHLVARGPSEPPSRPAADQDSEPDSRGAEGHSNPEEVDLSGPVFDVLTEEHLAFFHKYGFVVVRGLHNRRHVERALEGANKLLHGERRAKDGGRGEQAFGGLPEGKRSIWGRCTVPELEDLFKVRKNKEMMKHFVGSFTFRHHDGPGYYTFAPRFHRWSQEPTDTPSSQSFTVHAYNPKRLPRNLSPFAKEFIEKAAKLGVRVAPSQDHNWHLDGEDYNSSMVFNVLWGSYINGLPKGGMGNLQVYPGSHHFLAKVMRTRGPYWVWDGKCETQTETKPDLTCPGISENQPYALCVKAGDIVLAHPWLAHGIGCNTSDQHRLAVYCRLHSDTFYWPPDSCDRMKVAGQSLGPTPWTVPGKDVRWTGDPWACIPGLNEWIQNSKDKIDAYDGGSLSRAMTAL